MARLDGKVAIVTGGGRGIGQGIAEVFGQSGAKVMVADLDPDAARATAERLVAAGGEASHRQVDVTRWEDAETMADDTVARFGRIDILCSNAGIYPENPIEEMTADEWDSVLAVNLRGAFLTLKACLPQMRAQKFGRVVVTSSITGNRTAVPALTHYAASKGGVNGFIRGAAFEVAKYNITVNGVEPGIIDTEGLRAMGPDMLAEVAKILPLGKIGTPHDVGHAMAFLASDEAGFITGQTIVLDGGQTLSEFQAMVPPPA